MNATGMLRVGGALLLSIVGHAVAQDGVVQGKAAPAPARDARLAMAEPVKPEAAASVVGEPWMGELPSVASVRTKITGRDANDTAARCDAAFEVLVAYVQARAGFAPPAAAPVGVSNSYRAYQSARDARGALSAEASAHLAQGTRFELEILNALLPAQSVAQYQATATFSAKQAEEAKAAEALAAAERVRAAKQQLTADRDVFGVTLLEPLALPACEASLKLHADLMGIGRGAKQTCRSDRGAIKAIASSILATVAAADAKLSWLPIVLAADACPPWMKNGGSCVFMVAVADDVVAGALLPTGLDAKTIETWLAAKYQQPAADGDAVQCGNRKTRDVTSHTVERVWTLGGLSVSFEPVSRDCAHGRILLRTSLLQVPATTLQPGVSTSAK